MPGRSRLANQSYSRSPLPREGVALGFAAVDAREIRRGMRELAIALQQCRRAP
jgi:DNA-binding transcriptional MocR family regulator